MAVSSSFISRDNNDPSARNIKAALAGAGFEREQTLLWNVVPYCVSTVQENRNATPAQIRAAIPKTQEFMGLIRNLEVVVFCGRRAQKAAPLLRFTAKKFETFHTGAMSFNRASMRDDIHATFAEARRQISN